MVDRRRNHEMTRARTRSAIMVMIEVGVGGSGGAAEKIERADGCKS